MTTRYTQDEWQAIFHQTEKDIKHAPSEYKAPNVGSEAFAKSIDHTSLKPEANKKQIDALCEEAKKYNFKSVCIRLHWVKHAVQQLQGSSVVVACVIGFHEGTQTTSEKVSEAAKAIEAGAQELDMVLNCPLLKRQHYSEVYSDIAAVRNVAPHPTLLKVILETSQLNQSMIIAGSKIAQLANADYIKTSTGFNGPGASIENVRLMRAAVAGSGVKVKASGGVKTVSECIAMMEAGAERIGTSNGVWIMDEGEALLEDVTKDAGKEEGKMKVPGLTRMFSSSS